MAAHLFYRTISKLKLKEIWLWLSLLLYCINFIIFDKFYLAQIRTNPKIPGYLAGRYLPLPFSFTNLKWIFEKPFELLKDPGNFDLAGITMFAFITGILVTWKQNKHWAMLILGPVFITLLASLFNLYPLAGRFCLFLVPIVILLACFGAYSIFQYIKNNSKLCAYTFIILFLAFPVYNAVRNARTPYANENIRPVIEYVLKN
ncbi:MAG: hypothetical protein ABIA63_02935, partial [bacterium]